MAVCPMSSRERSGVSRRKSLRRSTVRYRLGFKLVRTAAKYWGGRCAVSLPSSDPAGADRRVCGRLSRHALPR